MPAPTLFVGVVSHEGSRFSVSQGPEGLAARLAADMAGAEVVVNTVNLLPQDSPLVTPRALQASLTAELRLDATWARFLGRSRGPRWWGVHGSRWVKRAWHRVRPPATNSLRRLLNIELSHLDLMRRGLESGAPWVLIVEDDGFTSDISDLSGGLVDLMAAADPPGFVNLSESFTSAQLGIDHLLSASGTSWAGAVDRSVLAASRPVTNTVCAILYSAPFLVRLVETMEALPMEPVVPIDWKLNLALMELFHAGSIPAGTCWLVEPAPITQMSMRPAAILPS